MSARKVVSSHQREYLDLIGCAYVCVCGLMALVQVNLYISGFEVTRKGGASNDLAVRVAAPATRWSQEVLVQRGSLVDNAYEVKKQLNMQHSFFLPLLSPSCQLHLLRYA